MRVSGAAGFAARTPAPPPDLREEARLLRARALEEAYFVAPDRARLMAALDAWRILSASGRHVDEAKRRSKALSGAKPVRGSAQPVCG